MGDFQGVDDADPRFLQRLSRQPGTLEVLGNLITGFAEGAYSWPYDWTLCMHWIAGTAGYYGSRVQDTCNRHTNRIVSTVGQSARLAYYLFFRGLLMKLAGNSAVQEGARLAIRQVDWDLLLRTLPPLAHAGSRYAGRSMTGSAFTAWMASGGRISAAPRGRAIGVASFNFVALLWGSALHVSLENPGPFDIIGILACWLTGDPTYRLTDDQYKTAFEIVMMAEESFLGADQDDYASFRAVLDILLRFGRSGGSP